MAQDKAREVTRRSPKPEFSIGQQVIFHAFQKDQEGEILLLCQGIIKRLPKPESPVYKVIIIAVNARHIYLGYTSKTAELAPILLNKVIARKPCELSKDLPPFLFKIYQDPEWIKISEEDLKKIQNKLKKKR